MSLPEIHETLYDRAVIEVFLKPSEERSSPIHVGSGRTELVKPIIRFPVNGRFTTIIPSDSIKGILRAEATRIAKSMAWKGDVETSVRAHTRKDLHEVVDNSDFMTKATIFLKQCFTETQIEEVKDRALEIYASANCPVCRLFGSRYLSGKLQITDAIPNHSPRILTHTSVAINRRSRTAEEGRLFTIEYIPPSPDLTFEFNIIADNVDRHAEARLLARLLDFLLLVGVRLGGSKSRGYGLLKIDEETTYVKYVNFSKSPSERLENLRRLLMKEGYYEKMSLREYAQRLLT